MPRPYSGPLWLAIHLAADPAAGPTESPPDQHALGRVALWGLELTPKVSPEPPDTVLLEISGSLRLLGGHSEITRRARQALAELALRSRLATAPTPQGARLMARYGHPGPITDHQALRAALRPLPCQLLDPTPDEQGALAELGITTLGDCLSLPRGGLRRRLGKALVARLEQAVGERPEPRSCIEPPQSYHERLELPAPSASSQATEFALQRLLRSLVGVLRGRDAAVQQIRITLEHAEHAPTEIDLGFLHPTRDMAHMGHIARHRLERQRLPEPVHAITLRADTLLPYHGATASLFQGTAQDPETSRILIDRLIARLGPRRVRGLMLTPDPRPERAWHRSPLEERRSARSYPLPPRPSWLLPHPQPLDEAHGNPLWNGPLRLEAGPERIESGWWDGYDVCRDYYVARSAGGSRAWVFRERRPPYRWYLHGFFG